MRDMPNFAALVLADDARMREPSGALGFVPKAC
jgi:hypothetical protein